MLRTELADVGGFVVGISRDSVATVVVDVCQFIVISVVIVGASLPP